MNETDTNVNPKVDATLGQDVRALLKHWLRGRRGLVVVGLAVAATGLWLGWSSLVAVGIAPLLLGVLPCVAMCALALCMGLGRRRSCGTQGSEANTPGETTSASNAKESTRNG